jgi:hypothetical protein
MKTRHTIQRISLSDITLDDGSVWKVDPLSTAGTWSVDDIVELERSHNPPTIWNVKREAHVKVSAAIPAA